MPSPQIILLFCRDLNERLYNLVSNYETQGKKDRIMYLRMVSYNLKKVDVIKEENVLQLLPAGATASATAHIGINEFINSKKNLLKI